jgi:hypothetical protein
MKKLNILELHRTINEKNMKKTETYEKVLEICHRKITLGSQTKQLRCMFEVPEYVPGYPIFDLNSCIKYLLTTLKANGFLVTYYFPKILYISWDFDEIKAESQALAINNNIKEKQHSEPISQKKLTKSIQLNNNQITNKNLLTSSIKLQEKKTGKLELNLF